MSDFLHNLRNGNANNRYDRPRKNYDNSPYRPTDRHNPRDKRNGNQRKPYPSEQLTVIKKILEEIQGNQKELIQAARDRAVSEKRMAEALEAIAAHLVTIPSGKATEVAEPIPAPAEAEEVVETEAEIKAEIEAAPADEHGEPSLDPALDRKKEALAIIHPLRKKGLTYEKIARHLDTQGIPTVSGRGKWRGQAVSKLIAEA